MKTRNTLLAATIVLLTVTGCRNKPIVPEFATMSIDTLLTEGDSSQYQVIYDFVSIANAAQSPALEAIERANIEYVFQQEEFTGTPREALEASLRQLAEELRPAANMPWEWRQMHYEQSVSTDAEVVDSLLVYTLSQWSFTGGAHAIYGTTTHTYSLASGLELMLTDLFTTEQIEQLNALIRQKLYEEYNTKDDEGLIQAGFFPEYIAANDNFRIWADGSISFCYNPYDIGCYALGQVEVNLSRENVDALRGISPQEQKK